MLQKEVMQMDMLLENEREPARRFLGPLIILGQGTVAEVIAEAEELGEPLEDRGWTKTALVRILQNQGLVEKIGVRHTRNAVTGKPGGRRPVWKVTPLGVARQIELQEANGTPVA